eukprot:475634-Pleurochrysis_carterae.AAC.1
MTLYRACPLRRACHREMKIISFVSVLKVRHYDTQIAAERAYAPSGAALRGTAARPPVHAVRPRQPRDPSEESRALALAVTRYC